MMRFFNRQSGFRGHRKLEEKATLQERDRSRDTEREWHSNIDEKAQRQQTTQIKTVSATQAIWNQEAKTIQKIYFFKQKRKREKKLEDYIENTKALLEDTKNNRLQSSKMFELAPIEEIQTVA